MTEATNQTAQHVETFRATAQGKGWPTSVVISDTEWTLRLDEPKEDGGLNSAPNPMHYFTASLAGCQNEQAQVVAEELGLTATQIDMTIAITLNLDGFMGVTEHSQGAFQHVAMTAVVQGEISEQQVLTLGQGVDARCPILELLRASGCMIESRWQKAG